MFSRVYLLLDVRYFAAADRLTESFNLRDRLQGACQHRVAKKCNASPTLINCKMKLRNLNSRAPKHALSRHVFRGARRQSVSIGVLKGKKINVAEQGQPKHSKAWPVPCFKNAAYRI